MEILELLTSDMRQKILFDCGGDFFTVMVRQEFMFIGNNNARVNYVLYGINFIPNE